MRLPITIDGIACTRIAIILIPSYTAAALTGEMVWTVPDPCRGKCPSRQPQAH